MNNTLQIKVEDSTTDLLIKEYEQQRVVTFKDIDELHQRAEGTAGRNFRENKEFFVEGVDYFNLSGESLEKFATTNFVGTKVRSLILITQTGYPMLTKSMNDSLSWAVQRELVNNYFSPMKKKARPKSLNTVLRKNVTTAKYMEELGISKGIASAKAIELTEKETGADLSAWKVLLPYKIDKESTHNPTELGKMIGCKAQRVNKLLIEHGLQIRLDNGNYEVTELGKKYSELLPFARNGHSDYQIKWKKSVLEVIGKGV
jgi:hypothetical protein